jgi:hypothetical protein
MQSAFQSVELGLWKFIHVGDQWLDDVRWSRYSFPFGIKVPMAFLIEKFLEQMVWNHP